MYAEDNLLPVSALADLAFCERRAALHHIEHVWEESVLTVEGAGLHDKVHREDSVESRGNIRVSRGLRLKSVSLGLSGVADVVEFRRVERDAQTVTLRGVDGFWVPFPVEYKHGRVRHEEGYVLQLCAQALCLEEMLHCAIPAGALFYGGARRGFDVTFDPDVRDATVQVALRLHQLFDAAETPPAAYEKKCESCSLLSICMPKVVGGRKSATRFLNEALKS
jgi:CRISPR-associated exonuclease Cas4